MSSKSSAACCGSRSGLERNRKDLSWPERQRRYFLADEVSRLEQQRKDAVSELKALGVQMLDMAHGRVGFPDDREHQAGLFLVAAGRGGRWVLALCRGR